jgi:hypothetical protein
MALQMQLGLPGPITRRRFFLMQVRVVSQKARGLLVSTKRKIVGLLQRVTTVIRTEGS